MADPAAETAAHRPIRSYVRREGRITRAQRRALDELWPIYGIDAASGPIVFERVYGRRVPVIMEIGFGDGAGLAATAAAFPQCDFLGVEVYRPGVGALLRRLRELGLTNVRVMCADAVTVLAQCVPVDALTKLLIFFPDPWPKKRHHKRRLVQPGFVALAVDRLRPGGQIHVATDWEDYARHALDVLGGEPRLRNIAGAGAYAPRPAYRPQTKYERRGESLGHPVWDLMFERVA